MATTNFDNATLKLLIEDTAGIVTVASLQQTDPSASLQTAMFTLNNAQIKALPTTPFVIIPATETLDYAAFPSTIFHIIRGFMVLDTTHGAYTNLPGNQPFNLYWGSDKSLQIAFTAQMNPSSPYLELSPLLLNVLNKTSFSFFCQEKEFSFEDLLDNSVVLSIADTGGNFTGGNVANSLTGILYYLPLSL